MNFYSVIIGTELLNGRRQDAHFSFLNKELLKRGWEQKGSFVIKDEPPFMENVYNLIKKDPNAVMFSFGGIGATPDDYTRQTAANVFTSGKMEENQGAKKAILDKFGDQSYPHRIQMAQLPLNAGLLENIITNVPGFYLEKKYFFVPGFPSMAQHMIIEALDKFYPKGEAKYRLTLTAKCGENILIDTMKTIPSHIDMSSLPQINGDKRSTVISIASNNEEETKSNFEIFTKFLIKNNVKYTINTTK